MKHCRGKSSIKTESLFLLKVIFRDFHMLQKLRGYTSLWVSEGVVTSHLEGCRCSFNVWGQLNVVLCL